MKLFQLLFVPILVILTCFFATSTGGNNNRVFDIDDGIRHLRFAETLNKYGIIKTYSDYNWGNLINNTILTDYSSDLWQGHHLLLVGFEKMGFHDLDILKLYASLIFGLICFLILFIGNKLKIPFIISLFVLFPVFLNQQFIFRTLLARPFSFSAIIFGVVILSLIHLTKSKYSPFILGTLFLLGTFYHTIFYLLLIPVVIYIVVVRPSFFTTSKLFSSVLLGLFFGIIFHESSIDYLILSFYQAIVPIFQNLYSLHSGELVGLHYKIFFHSAFIINVVLGGILVYLSHKNNKLTILGKNVPLLFVVSNFTFLFLVTILIGRFVDYFFITAYILMIYLVSEIISFKQLTTFINKINKKTYTVIMVCALIIVVYFQATSGFIRTSTDIHKEVSFLRDSEEKIEKGSNIATFGLLDFPMVYYALGESYKYHSVMEPIFFYYKDKELFLTYTDLMYSHFRKPLNPVEISYFDALKKYDANYLVFFGNVHHKKEKYSSSELLKIKIREINNDSRFTLITQDGENYLWKLTN